MDAHRKTPLTFFQQTIPEPFKNDSNADIGDIFIALVYPEILIRDATGDYVIECRQDGFHAEADDFPLLNFLEMFPTIYAIRLSQRAPRSSSATNAISPICSACDAVGIAHVMAMSAAPLPVRHDPPGP